MTAAAAVRHVVDVEGWMLAGNDDAPAPGRVLVLAGCGACGEGRRMLLWPGRWSVEHTHRAGWAARAVRPPTPGAGPSPLPRPVPAAALLEARALAARLAGAMVEQPA